MENEIIGVYSRIVTKRLGSIPVGEFSVTIPLSELEQIHDDAIVKNISEDKIIDWIVNRWLEIHPDGLKRPRGGKWS